MERFTIPGATHAMHVHDRVEDCTTHGCVIHCPTATDPANAGGWPYVWRLNKHGFERTCPHGVDHPDADELRWRARTGRDAATAAVHRCDGCCQTDSP